jgi:hypothetical protein
MRVFRKILLVLTVISCFTECVNLKDVTQEGLESYGAELFQNFVYFISKDIILRETVEPGANLTQDDAGNVLLFNREINLSRRTRGRVKNVSAQRIEVAFEELPGETRPILTFKQNPKDEQKRYFIDYKWSDDVILVDPKGDFGYIKTKGPVISYNGVKYLLIFNGDELPCLIQDLNIKIINEYRQMRGLR